MKKTYMKPATQVVKIQQQHIICGSKGAKSLNNSEGFDMNTSGFGDNDDDM